MSEAEKIVGTSVFFGECWKTVLRTPRTRMRGMTFLNERIPKDIRSASRKAKDGGIYIGKLYAAIVNGRLIVEAYDP